LKIWNETKKAVPGKIKTHLKLCIHRILNCFELVNEVVSHTEKRNRLEEKLNCYFAGMYYDIMKFCSKYKIMGHKSTATTVLKFITKGKTNNKSFHKRRILRF
jgi:hypothetical protein